MQRQEHAKCWCHHVDATSQLTVLLNQSDYRPWWPQGQGLRQVIDLAIGLVAEVVTDVVKWGQLDSITCAVGNSNSITAFHGKFASLDNDSDAFLQLDSK